MRRLKAKILLFLLLTADINRTIIVLDNGSQAYLLLDSGDKWDRNSLIGSDVGLKT
jgi:hypothetical protein